MPPAPCRPGVYRVRRARAAHRRHRCWRRSVPPLARPPRRSGGRRSSARTLPARWPPAVRAAITIGTSHALNLLDSVAAGVRAPAGPPSPTIGLRFAEIAQAQRAGTDEGHDGGDDCQIERPRGRPLRLSFADGQRGDRLGRAVAPRSAAAAGVADPARGRRVAVSPRSRRVGADSVAAGAAAASHDEHQRRSRPRPPGEPSPVVPRADDHCRDGRAWRSGARPHHLDTSLDRPARRPRRPRRCSPVRRSPSSGGQRRRSNVQVPSAARWPAGGRWRRVWAGWLANTGAGPVGEVAGDRVGGPWPRPSWCSPWRRPGLRAGSAPGSTPSSPFGMADSCRAGDSSPCRAGRRWP